jgi:S-adenosylmethionine hydrolase
MIVLLTDFGQGEYVGVMKGVIYRKAPEVKIVDLCHDISPQSVVEASWLLKNNYRFFPKGAVFCCVVDPGVGTERKALAVRTGNFYFVAPDNGLLWETIREQETLKIRGLSVPEDASKTFHGRDVFAKAAADVSLGLYEELGLEAEGLEKLELYLKGREGLVVRIDRFGNIITNLPREDKNTYRVEIGGRDCTMDFRETYAGAKENELFLIEGSCGTLEISLKNASANDTLNVGSGQKITIR